MEEKAKGILYYPDRAIELASNLPGLLPVRLFAVLYPLWLVEIDAEQEAKRPYALIEQYIERGIREAQLRTVEEIVDFFCLSTGLVIKVLLFLETIQHVQRIDNHWVLTERGEKSLSEGTKSVVWQEKGQCLYFDGFCSKPLLQEHYKGLNVIPDMEAETVTRTPRGGYKFQRLHGKPWNARALNELIHLNHSERAKYNLPPESHAITLASQAHVYMPMYIIETRMRRTRQPCYVVFTHVKGRRDTFFEQIINTTQDVWRALGASSEEENLAEIWSKWLRNRNLVYLQPEQTPDGLWRVVLPEHLFQSTELPVWKIGTYYKERGYFLQYWCHSEAMRRQAVMDYTLSLVKKSYKTLKREYIEEALRQRSELLEVIHVQLHELHRWASNKACEEGVLQKLAAWCAEADT